MPGTNTKGLLLTERDRRLFGELAIAGVADRVQAAIFAGFLSISVANARLHKLVASGFLNRFFFGTRAGGRKALYTLTSKAAALVEMPVKILQRKRDSLLAADQFTQHRLAINDIRIQAQFRTIPQPGFLFARWLVFPAFLSNSIPLVPDGYFEIESPEGTLAMFCEVDRGMESQKVWKQKTELYLRLATSGEFEKLFGKQRFRVLVVTTSPGRLQSLRVTIAALTEKIFRFADLETINRNGLFSPCWLRTRGEERHSLL
jgi:hypothetical protein